MAAIHDIAPRTNSVAFGLRQLEPWVGWAIGAYTALMAVGGENSGTLWLFAIYAALVGKWAEHKPARDQLHLFARALALIAGAFVLHSHAGTDPGGRGDVFFFWLAIATASYAFLLRAGWAWGTLALGLFAYVLSWMEAPPPDAWLVLVSQGGFLCIFVPMVAMRFGAVMRRSHGVVDDQLTDKATGLLNRAGLLQHGDELAAAALRERQSVALALFDCASLGAVYEFQGRGVGRKVRDAWVRELKRLAGDRGLVGRTGPTQYAVVLPGVSATRAQRLVERELGAPMRIELPGTRVAFEPKLAARDIERELPLAALFDLMEQDLMPQGVQQAVADSEPMQESVLTRIDLGSILSVTEYEGNGFAATDVMSRPAAA